MYIEMEDLVGNCFISYLEQTGNRILELQKIEKFGYKVVEQLEKEGEHPYLRLSRDITNEFFYKYAEWFTLSENDNKTLVVLNKDVSVEKLIKEFSGYLNLKTLVAFRNPENIKVLL